MQLVGNGQLPQDTQTVSIKIVDILGAPVAALASETISAVVKQGVVVSVPKTNLVARSSDKTVFTLSLSAAKLTRGAYTVEVNVQALVKSLAVRLLGRVKVSNLEIGIGEVDSTSNIKKTEIVYNNKLGEILNADAQQKIVLRADLLDESSGEAIGVHQAFVRLAHVESQEEIIFVAEQDYSKAYKFDLVC